MSATDVHGTSRDASVGRVDMKLEVMIIPVSDVDRSKEFYERLGWRLDRDVAPMEGLRVVQFTPPGSGTSVTFGQGLTTAAPGSAEGELVVSDIEAAYDELVGRGIEVSLARPAIPGRGAAAGPRPRAHQLQVVLVLHRSRWQHVAGPGGHDTALDRSPTR
jgi:catechol 2,3-dioxygenase-like lactoylglutathione lyase family enzyme